MGNLNRGSTASYDLKGKSQAQADSLQSVRTIAAGIGLVGSAAYFLMLVGERPKLGLWVAALAAVALMGVLIYKKVRQHKDQGKHIPYDQVRSHQVGRFGAWLKHENLGHPNQIGQLTEALDRDLRLAGPGKVLGVYLVAGPSGTGKTHLSKLLGQALFGPTKVIEIDFKNLHPTVFATKFNEMIIAVNQNPTQLIILENVGSMDEAMLEPFLEILKTGQWVREVAPLKTSFSACAFICTCTTDLPAEMASEILSDQHEAKIRKWFDQMQYVDSRLLSFCSEFIVWGNLAALELAEVTCRTLEAYWKSHGIDLDYVAPNAVLSILKEARDQPQLGLHPIPQIIRKKSAQGLERALLLKAKRVALDLGENALLVPGNFNQVRKRSVS